MLLLLIDYHVDKQSIAGKSLVAFFNSQQFGHEGNRD